MPFESLLKLMAAYDAAQVGSDERVRLGEELDRESSKKLRSERDYWNAVVAYKKLIEGKVLCQNLKS